MGTTLAKPKLFATTRCLYCSAATAPDRTPRYLPFAADGSGSEVIGHIAMQQCSSGLDVIVSDMANCAHQSVHSRRVQFAVGFDPHALEITADRSGFLFEKVIYDRQESKRHMAELLECSIHAIA